MKNIKEQLLIVKNEAPDIFAAVIAGGGGVGICPSYFGLQNTCNKTMLCDCEACWNFVLDESEESK